MNDGSVAATNDSSTTSKCSMCRLGYFDDPYIRNFVAKPNTRRAPIINRGYFVRTWAVDEIVKSFLTATTASPRQIVSLGAGFDTLYFRLRASNLVETCTFVEVDFPSVMKRKMELIKRTGESLPICAKRTQISITSDDSLVINVDSGYILAGCDLRNTKLLDDILRELVDRQSPTLVLAECVLTYLAATDSDAVLRYFAETFTVVTVAVYEQISPNDRFGRRMCDHFRSINSPLRTISTYPSKAAVQQRYINLGYKSDAVSVVDMNHIYNCVLSETERNRLSEVEPFDEFEPWHLKCSHYVLCIAASPANSAYSSIAKWLGHSNFYPTSELEQLNTVFGTANSEDEGVYANSVCKLKSYNVTTDSSLVLLASGGVGCDGKRHTRLSKIQMWTLTSASDPLQTRQLVLSSDHKCLKHELERCHHKIWSINPSLLCVYGGRRSPIDPCPLGLLLVLDTVVGAVNLKKTFSISTPRWRFASCEINWNGGNALVICGGRSSDKVLSSCLLLEWDAVSEAVVEKLLPDLPLCLHSASCVYSSDQQALILSGGLHTLNSEANDKIWFLHLTDDVKSDLIRSEWRQLNCAGIVETSAETARYGHRSHLVNADRGLLLVGGCSPLYNLSDVVLIDLKLLDSETNTRRPVLRPCRLLPTDALMTVGHESVVIDDVDGCIWLLIVGGGGNCFSFGTVFNPLFSFVKLDSLLNSM